jgi:3-oxoacyl-[acyl-carrier protein] reductase
MIDPGLEGKVVVVTGANHGIGAATAQAFAAQGAKVFIHYLRLMADAHGMSEVEAESIGEPGEALYRAQQMKSADEVVQAICAQGDQAASWEADLADTENIRELFERAEAAFGPVDVLVNNAAHWEPDTFLPSIAELSNELPGLWSSRLISTITAESHDRHFAVNSRAVALLMAEFARRHIAREARWGRIVNVSTDGASCFPSEISYGASKHALESYSRAAAVELGPYGITVNVVSPGPVQTGYIAPELEEKLLPEIPLRRIGQPEDIADAIVFLASEQARWITGQLIYVGGGHVMLL